MIGRIDVQWDSTLIGEDFVYQPEADQSDSTLIEQQGFVQPDVQQWIFTRTDERSYYGKDHLGNIRLVLDENNLVLNAQDYYPYGEVLRSFTSGGYSPKYLYTEKERDTETSYDYFGARYYDSELGRWLSVDPLAAKYPSFSPYSYALNNPIKYVDPNGMESASSNWGEGVENSIKRHRQEKQQENTWNTLIQVGNYIEKGAQMIADGISQNFSSAGDKTMNGLQKSGETILSDGPSTLNELSVYIATSSYISTIVSTAVGFPEVGTYSLSMGSGISLGLDGMAIALSMLNHSLNPTRENYNKARNQIINTGFGYGVGKGFDKAAQGIGETIEYFKYYREFFLPF